MLIARAMRTTIAMVMVALVTGCVEAKAPVDDDVTAAFVADSKADLPTNTKYLGDLGKGGPTFPVVYTRSPRYRSVGFGGVSGDVVDIWVTSTDGDPVAWLLDFQGNVIAMNDDASSKTFDSHIHTTLTASNGRYFIYFREYSLHKSHMTVTETSSHVGGSAGDAETAWDAAVTAGIDNDQIKAASLSAGARATYDKYAAKFGSANAWSIPDGNGGHYDVVGGAVEEIFWIDIYDASGNFIVHGASGDSGPDITFWGFPAQSWDPSQQ